MSGSNTNNWFSRLFGTNTNNPTSQTGGTQDLQNPGDGTSSPFSNMLSLGQLGLNAYLGLKQLDVAEDTLAFQEEAFSKQYEANKALTNAELAWQHQAREDRLAGSGGEQVQIS